MIATHTMARRGPRRACQIPLGCDALNLIHSDFARSIQQLELTPVQARWFVRPILSHGISLQGCIGTGTTGLRREMYGLGTTSILAR